ncbi:Mur ligase family protein [Sulfitobacter sp. F26204]|uniref:bifunctional folylpolyglutamate synthase/dihydrofolate synthase n=1 Tax=Sulfitobacter sp. F26204 TaxID=2996014 RepID=UPI00225E6970|nr:Mur ligase family protein [Sulfitobacter sp. F26204]MCX7558067.1 Mur ligase family protein [Sulfitobacter sp. F26204]
MNAQTSDVILERMMALHPKVMDLTLDRMFRLLAALDNPQERLPPIVHLAGTNGKGSTQAMIRAGLEAAGKTVHAYTSPHLARFHERIRLAGTLIDEEALAAVLDECYAVNADQMITYFEITTAAALLAFARMPADFTLLEVGLGGRLDATNVTDKVTLSIITPVSLDHQQYLGETLAEIAGEKAGIIKRNVPCVVGPQQDEALEVIEAVAAKKGAPLMVYGQHWHVGIEGERMVYQDDHGLLDLPLPNLLGAHQVQNAGAALAALRLFGMDAKACEAAVTTAQWPARMQRLRTGPLIEIAGTAELWLDGGHNAAAGQALAAVLAQGGARPTHLICGMLNTKDITGYMRPLAEHVQSLQAVSIPGEAATLSAAETAQAARAVGIAATEADSVETALRSIIKVDPLAKILICGSLYLAGAVLRQNG